MTERSEFNQRILNAMPAVLINHVLRHMITSGTNDEAEFAEYIKNFAHSAEMELTGNTQKHTDMLRMVSFTKGKKLTLYLMKHLKDTRRCILMLTEWTLELHDAGAINIFESLYHKDILEIRDKIEAMVEKYSLEKQQQSTDKQMVKFHNYAIKIGLV